jgi:hypothetical protein
MNVRTRPTTYSNDHKALTSLADRLTTSLAIWGTRQRAKTPPPA